MWRVWINQTLNLNFDVFRSALFHFELLQTETIFRVF